MRICTVVALGFLLASGVGFGNSLFDSMLTDELWKHGPEPDFGLYQDAPEAPEASKKSLPKAVFLSILLPGAGHHYLDAKRQARMFWGIEAAMWAGYLGLNWYGARVREDYKLYAAAEADANPGINSDDYYHAVERYRTNETYNEEVRREARALHPYDLEAQRQYILENGYWGEDGWSWDDDGAWEEYAHLRTMSRDYLHKATYCLGATLLNRVVSAIFAAKLTKDRSARLEEGNPGLNLRFEPDMDRIGIRAVLAYTY